MKKSATSNPKQNPARHARQQLAGYTSVHHNIVQLLHTARQNTARAVNAFITAAYWEIGRHIVEFEQRGVNCAQSSHAARTDAFPRPWPAYDRLLAVKDQHARTLQIYARYGRQLVTNCYQLQSVTDCCAHVTI